MAILKARAVLSWDSSLISGFLMAFFEVFSLVWSIGCVLQTNSRPDFGAHLRQLLPLGKRMSAADPTTDAKI